MTIQLFLNDLSFPDEDCALHVALDRLASLVSILRAVGKVGTRYVINADRPFSEISFGLNHPLASLRNEAAATEHRTYLKTIVDRTPWTVAMAELPEDDAGGPDYRMPDDAPTCAGAPAPALGLAHDLSGVAVSMPTHDHWQAATVGIIRTTLNADAQEIEVRVEAPNACHAAHVADHAETLKAAMMPDVDDGSELWARRAELLPNLRFVPTARKPIEDLGHGDPNLRGAIERLTELDAAIGAWKRDKTGHPTYPFDVSPESRSRLDEGLADIKDADGYTRTFSDHARYGPDENRIHFIVETDPERHALVGHVGRKLGIG